MNYKVIEALIPFSPSKRRGTLLDWDFMTIHNTANPTSSALNERNWLVNPRNTRTASWNVCIDEKHAVIAIPTNERSHHAGARGNEVSLGVEICESGNYNISMRNAVHYAATELLKKGKNITALRTHQSWTGKYCPGQILRGWQGWTWNRFKDEVAKEMARQLYSEKPWHLIIRESMDRPDDWIQRIEKLIAERNEPLDRWWPEFIEKLRG